MNHVFKFILIKGLNFVYFNLIIPLVNRVIIVVLVKFIIILTENLLHLFYNMLQTKFQTLHKGNIIKNINTKTVSIHLFFCVTFIFHVTFIEQLVIFTF